MIQRIQSVWLLVAGLLSLATFRLHFFFGNFKDGSVHKLGAQNSNLLIYVAVILLVVVALGAIFLFKQRPLQTRLCWLGIVLSIALLVLEIEEVAGMKSDVQYAGTGTWRPGIILPILIMVAFFLAWRGIRKDHKLVKSLDRLR